VADSEPPETTAVPVSQPDAPILPQIERRLVEADSPQEILLWTQVRGEILRQDDLLKDQEHRRKLERIQVLFKMGLSIVAVMTGTTLVVGGFPYAGLFVLGAGLYGLAPDYVKNLFQRREESENS
jgi:hypothetical protein